MVKLGFFVLSVLLTSQVKSTLIKSPRGLVDEVETELEALMNVVQGAIAAGHINLANFESEFLANSNTVLATGENSIDQEKQSVDIQLTSLKELAMSSGVDITSCTSIREALLNQLPQEYNNQIRVCVDDKNQQAGVLVNDATYFVDIIINKVHDLEFQINQCDENLLCLSPLLNEIQLDKIRLPKSVSREVHTTESLLALLRIQVQECSETKVSQFVGEATALLADIIDCAETIMG